MEEKNILLDAENSHLNEILKKDHITDIKLKGKANRVELEVEERLKKSKSKLALSLERNLQLKRDVFQINEEFDMSLKWANS